MIKIDDRFRFIGATVCGYIACVAFIYLGSQLAVTVTHLPGPIEIKRGPTFEETYYTLSAIAMFVSGIAFGIYGIARTLNPDSFR